MMPFSPTVSPTPIGPMKISLPEGSRKKAPTLPLTTTYRASAASPWEKRRSPLHKVTSAMRPLRYTTPWSSNDGKSLASVVVHACGGVIGSSLNLPALPVCTCPGLCAFGARGERHKGAGGGHILAVRLAMTAHGLPLCWRYACNFEEKEEHDGHPGQGDPPRICTPAYADVGPPMQPFK